MKRRARWGMITALTALLMTPFFVQDQAPFAARQSTPTPAKTPAKADARTAQIRALAAKKAQGNESVVAKDIARTASLCVRDCRTMLTEISNELGHAGTTAERLHVLKQHLSQHSQFVALTLTEDLNNPLQVGHPLRSDLLKQAHPFIVKDNFYVSDLYRKPQANDPKEKIGMTLGVPVLRGSQVVGSLTADVEMGHLMQVIRTQDDEMGTKTSLVGLDCYNEKIGAGTRGLQDQGGNSEAKGGVKTRQVSRKRAVSKVDGTAWRVSVTSKGDKARIHGQVVHGQVLVRFDQALTQEQITKMTGDIKGKLVRNHSRNNRHVYIFQSDTTSTADMIAYFRSQGARIAEAHTKLRQNTATVKEGETTAKERVIESPNDTFYGSNQWNLPLIGADKAWQISTGDPKVIIAVVDTGVDLDHPDLKGQLTEGWNAIDGSNVPQDDNGHGTHVAGVIAARTNNLEGIAGIDWAGKIMPIKTMGADGSGSVVDIADGVIWAVDHGATVVNLSLGEYSDSDYLHEAIRYAYDKGAVVLAAMGNDGIPEPSYPAAYPEAIAVAANDETTESATFSNFGPHCSVSAPGVAIPSTYPDRRYVALSGTSMATPHVAGLAALIRSVNPDLTPDQVREILEQTSDDLGPSGFDDYYGHGQINIGRALNAARETVKS
ncbi:S8 family peptidase [Tumebacillus sp. DT12]|uniref:S8 family peptidase n=1 Tax=Tumebacillus lacus TaxID=2995335 RepID=A0ABT3WUN3_9BACL|nr:S8 family peptidase [Tumebacillus lacus]MCX7568398.1 S8 family peptidase [Tumebacillus lacus]